MREEKIGAFFPGPSPFPAPVPAPVGPPGSGFALVRGGLGGNDPQKGTLLTQSCHNRARNRRHAGA